MFILQAVDDDASLQGIHDDAEKFDPRTEQVFKYLQIISAAAMSFAHGANDVANAVGPFAAIYGIYQVSEDIQFPPQQHVADAHTHFLSAAHAWHCKATDVTVTKRH